MPLSPLIMARVALSLNKLEFSPTKCLDFLGLHWVTLVLWFWIGTVKILQTYGETYNRYQGIRKFMESSFFVTLTFATKRTLIYDKLLKVATVCCGHSSNGWSCSIGLNLRLEKLPQYRISLWFSNTDRYIMILHFIFIQEPNHSTKSKNSPLNTMARCMTMKCLHWKAIKQHRN